MRSMVILLVSLVDSFRSRKALQMEVLLLRHQLAIYQRSVKRPRLQPQDRAFWALVSRHCKGWRDALVMVRPDTVVRWQRRRFRDHWGRLSRSRTTGRPAVPEDVQALIRRMTEANPLWGAPRIRDELRMLGIDLAVSTVARYRGPRRRPSSPTWKAFLKAHLAETVAVDFLTVPTVRNRVLFVFLVLSLSRRRILHVGVTAHPTAAWTAQQMTEAFPWEPPPRYLQRDRDRIFGREFVKRVEALGMRQVISAPRSPWQNAYVERLIGSVRRECLDHVVILGERHLRWVLQSYIHYYNRWRPHQGLGGDAPERRERELPEAGSVAEIEEVFGLHHRYTRNAA